MPFTISRHCASVGVLCCAIAGIDAIIATQKGITLTVFMLFPTLT
jgi:hypothetical protein